MLQRTEEELSKFVTTHSMPEHRNWHVSESEIAAPQPPESVAAGQVQMSGRGRATFAVGLEGDGCRSFLLCWGAEAEVPPTGRTLVMCIDRGDYNLLLSGGLQLELAVHVTADFRAIVVVHVGCDSEAPSSGTRAQFLWCRV